MIDKNIINLFSDYLHDGYFYLDSAYLDNGRNIFIINVDRIYYEQPNERQYFKMLRYTKYKIIKSSFLIHPVKSFDIYWKDNAFSDDKSHLFLDIQCYVDNVIILASNFVNIIIKTKSDPIFKIKDIDLPSKKYFVTEYGHYASQDKILCNKIRDYCNAAHFA